MLGWKAPETKSHRRRLGACPIVTERRTGTVSTPDDRWANLEALGRATRGRAPRKRMSPRRRRRLTWTIVVALGLVVVMAAAGALVGYRYADRLVGKGKRRLGKIQTRQVDGRRTDTIIVLHISPGREKAVMVSIPRDLRADVGGQTNRINAAFSLGGPDLLVKTVQEVTGLPIQHYAEIDFAGFLKVVDAVGGVRLCNRTDRTLDDRFANLHMPPGCQQMNCIQALAFVRARHIDSDFGRIGRQQEFLRAVMDKVASKGNLVNLP